MVCFLLASCGQPRVITKESTEVARTAYAIKDAFTQARVDLADEYSDQLSKLVVPPKDAIKITPIIKNGKRVAVIPGKYTQDDVVVVGTNEWSDLLKIKDVVVQLANDKTNLNAQLEKTEEEVREQHALKEKLAADNIQLNLDIEKIKRTLLTRTLYIAGLLAAIAAYAYIKIKGIVLPFSLL